MYCKWQFTVLQMHKVICPFGRNKWAASWQNQQSDCAPSEDSDQPRHPPSLIRVFAVRMKKTWVLSHPLSAQRRLWSDWADAQADLRSDQTGQMLIRLGRCPGWSKSSLDAQSFYWFCHEAAQIRLYLMHLSMFSPPMSKFEGFLTENCVKWVEN